MAEWLACIYIQNLKTAMQAVYNLKSRALRSLANTLFHYDALLSLEVHHKHCHQHGEQRVLPNLEKH